MGEIPQSVLVVGSFVALCLAVGIFGSWVVAARVRRWVQVRTAENIVRFDHRSRRGYRGSWVPWPGWAAVTPERVHPLAWLILVAVLFYCLQLGFVHSLLPQETDLVGRVTHVRDGDTIEVSGSAVRFAGLDCAELGTLQGEKAKRRMQALASGKRVTCDLTGKRSYDRVVGSCTLADGTDLTRTMIREGYCGRW